MPLCLFLEEYFSFLIPDLPPIKDLPTMDPRKLLESFIFSSTASLHSIPRPAPSFSERGSLSGSAFPPAFHYFKVLKKKPTAFSFEFGPPLRAFCSFFMPTLSLLTYCAGLRPLSISFFPSVFICTSNG